MSDNPDATSRTFMPRLAYQDADVAARFLRQAFGFEEAGRFAPGGEIVHAEFSLNDSALFAIGTATPTAEGVQSPQQIGGSTVQLFCYVDDVDAHCQQARSNGATIVAEPRDQMWGDRTYEALDSEGYKWTFRKHVRDVTLEELESKIASNNDSSGAG